MYLKRGKMELMKQLRQLMELDFSSKTTCSYLGLLVKHFHKSKVGFIIKIFIQFEIKYLNLTVRLKLQRFYQDIHYTPEFMISIH